MLDESLGMVFASGMQRTFHQQRKRAIRLFPSPGPAADIMVYI